MSARGALRPCDDYGTGQASLAYLRDLPVDELKLDRTFLARVPSDTHNSAIVRSTIELAHALGLPIVAEGVENGATQAWLVALGCDIGQGYHIARPASRDQTIEWLRSQVATSSADRPIRDAVSADRPTGVASQHASAGALHRSE